jgi:pimeloyl-ACP methyl ester carboxylesterase/uncharacterized membrane protein YphA (DoxX/SURF4 family)
MICYRSADTGGHRVFYREAGKPENPTILLMHGFPTSSHMFRDLIPLLADRYHVVAPDLPGFGNTVSPRRGQFDYTFDNLARVIGGFVETVGLSRHAIYVFDYGVPVGFRLAVTHPDRITAIISQNGNAYKEGLSDGWTPIRAYWQDASQTNREALRAFLTPETTVWQYTHGVPDPMTVSPDGYSLDNFYLGRPGAAEVQLDLFGDYKSNVALYPTFQKYFRTYKPPFLAVWGKNDPFFLPQGAEAYRRDIPDAEVRFLDTGHFALETHAVEIGTAMRVFLGRHVAAHQRPDQLAWSHDCDRTTLIEPLAHGWEAEMFKLPKELLLQQWAPLPLRLMLGYGFVAHGWAKLSRGPAGFAKLLEQIGTPLPEATAWVSTFIEVLGGLAILAGALVTVVSLPLIVMMLVAMFKVHLRYGFSAINTIGLTADGPQFAPPGYEVNLLNVAGLLTLILAGAGPFSIDRLLARRKRGPAASPS